VVPGFVPLPRHTFISPTGRHLHVYGEPKGVFAGPINLPPSEPVAAHKRLDLLTGAWVAISPARNLRPHSRESEALEGDRAGCPFCPGGAEVPLGYEAAVLDNRFPTFVPDPPPIPAGPDIAPSIGRCEVVLYTDRHEGSLATLAPAELARVLAVWRDRSAELWADPRHRFVLIFENRGEAVGATLSHPHGQIYAFDHLPPLIETRLAAMARHRGERGSCLSCHLLASDEASERVIRSNGTFLVAQPFAPRWPYEVHVRARRHGLRRLTDLTPAEQRDLAGALHDVTVRYDALFGFELPYMMVIMEAPEGVDDWHLAVEFFPPHRNPQLTKVRASVETATGLFINDTLPEETARQLAAISVADRVEAASLCAVPAPAGV
jgi:UDPglucose--hexose-1-phosphate uridylyltransferase